MHKAYTGKERPPNHPIALSSPAMHQFAKHQIESSRPDGYWVEDFPFRIKDTRSPNLVGYGLGTSSQASKIQMFANPFHGGDLLVDI